MNADLLLEWMSESGSGEIRDLRQRVAWAARVSDRNPHPYETGRWLRDVSTLGHAEIDWDRSRWAMAPAAASLLPATGGVAVLAGSRRTGLIGRLELDLDVFELSAVTRSGSDPLPVPSAIAVQADTIAELRISLAAAGVRYAGCSARSIAAGLRQVSLGQLAAPPAHDDAVEHLAPDETARFVDGLPEADGLCRTTVFGRPSYRYRRGENWYRTDHASGILIDRADRGIEVVRYRPERFADGSDIGSLFIDQGAALPPLQARALVLCSGLRAEFGDHANTTIYRNVPRDIAQLVATSVRQPVIDLARATSKDPR